MKTLNLLMIIILISSCGGSSTTEPQTTQTQDIPSNQCPYGSFITPNLTETMLVSSSGAFSFKRNFCTSSGKVSCNGNKFTLKINTNASDDNSDCLTKGDYVCEYSKTGSGRFFIICSTTPIIPEKGYDWLGGGVEFMVN